MPTALVLGFLLFSPQERLDRLAKDYGIEIQVSRAAFRATRYGFSVMTEKVSDEALERYASTLETEWRRYPRSLMSRVGLKRIVVGARVRVEGQPRAAVPEFDRGWLWLDAEVGSRNPTYGKQTLHHDFFHMIDRRMKPGAQGRDPEWAALNPQGVRYGMGGWWMQTGGVGNLRTDLPGFLTAYSTSAVEEDKAEIFGHLICSPAFVEERVKADAVIAAKVARLKAMVAAFEPAMNEAWWRAP